MPETKVGVGANFNAFDANTYNDYLDKLTNNQPAKEEKEEAKEDAPKKPSSIVYVDDGIPPFLQRMRNKK